MPDSNFRKRTVSYKQKCRIQDRLGENRGINRGTLKEIPSKQRTGWIVNPVSIEYQISGHEEWFQPTPQDLKALSRLYSNCSIATACNVSETTVRKWLLKAGILRECEFKQDTGLITKSEVERVQQNAKRQQHRSAQRSNDRLTKERVGRVIALIGERAGVLVQREEETKRAKFASAHDLRRGCALRLINAGVSAETLKIVMRHKNFATTEKHYGAFRSAQSAAKEVTDKLANAENDAFVGGLVGGISGGNCKSSSTEC